MVMNLILFLLLCLTLLVNAARNKRVYRSIDKMLDCVLEGEKICRSDVKEGELSALASKINRIQEVMTRQVEKSDEEKEQVKSLVSNLSHQLKTPLTNLSLYAEILEQEDIRGEKRNEFISKMKKQIGKLDWVMSSLLKMIRLEQNVILPEPQELPIRQTILDAVDTVYDEVDKKGLQILVEPFEDCLLYHDRKWTGEVLLNLLENAVKYTEKGGIIRIRVHSFEIYTEIQIIDNGRGIPDTEIPEIFQRFYRGSGVGNIEGAGIGLYLSNLILEKEKGYVTVRSVCGEGSCFSVFLRNGGKG